MDWLKDKKNQPIVAGIVAVVLVVAGVLIWMQMKGDSSAPPADQYAQGPMGAPGPPGTGVPAPPGMPGPMGPGAPGMPAPPATPAAPTAAPYATAQPGTAPAAQPAAPAAGVKTVAVVPMEAWRTDPFQPVGYKPPKIKKPPKRIQAIPDFPFYIFPDRPGRRKREGEEGPREPAQPARRMAGLLLNERIYAIVETQGKSEIVQPGDTLSDRLAVVEKIERDKVILKTTSKKPRYITVRMAAAPRTAAAAAEIAPGPESGMPPGMRMPMPGMPGMPGMPPRAPRRARRPT